MTNSIKRFLESDYHGDGKYYTTEKGSRHYRNTAFGKFMMSNRPVFQITDGGNDAPRGGKTGNYVMVEFKPEFKKTASEYLDAKYSREHAAAQLIREAREAKAASIAADVAKLTPLVDAQYNYDVEKARQLRNGLERSHARIEALKALLVRAGVEITNFFETMKLI